VGVVSVVVALGVLVAVPEALSGPVALGVMEGLAPGDSELEAVAEARGGGVVDGVAVFDAVPVGVGVEEGLTEGVGEKDTAGEPDAALEEGGDAPGERLALGLTALAVAEATCVGVAVHVPLPQG
jgi:hypothetical protein